MRSSPRRSSRRNRPTSCAAPRVRSSRRSVLRRARAAASLPAGTRSRGDRPPGPSPDEPSPNPVRPSLPTPASRTATAQMSGRRRHRGSRDPRSPSGRKYRSQKRRPRSPAAPSPGAALASTCRTASGTCRGSMRADTAPCRSRRRRCHRETASDPSERQRIGELRPDAAVDHQRLTGDVRRQVAA